VDLIDRRLVARVAVTRRYLAVGVVLGLLATASVVAQAVLIASIVSTYVGPDAHGGDVTPQMVGLVVAFLVRAGCAWAADAAAHRTSATVTSTLRRQLLRHALALGPDWLAGERAGELSLAATRGIAALNVYFGRYLPVAVVAGVAPLAILIWVGVQDWPSMLILAGLVLLVPLAMIYFGRRASEGTTKQWRRLSSLSARFLELVQGLATLRAVGMASHGRREVEAATEGVREATMSTLRVTFLSALAMEFLAGIGVGLVAMVLGLRLLSGSVTLATALGVLLVSPEVFLPLRRAGAEFHASTEGQAAAERILGVLDLSVPDARPARVVGDEGSLADGRAELREVTVRRPGRAEPVLSDLDLSIGPGEHVAVVGPSGSGKSTLLAVLLGFVVPERGEVSASRAAWVPQKPHLFCGTVADNLRVGDRQADEARLTDALEAADLGPWIRSLPDGLATRVGDGGLSVSWGERQRLALARAWLHDAPLVLLDEPVAHLDAATEDRLRASLGSWLEARTVVVAAHRPELVARIDRVVDLGLVGAVSS